MPSFPLNLSGGAGGAANAGGGMASGGGMDSSGWVVSFGGNADGVAAAQPHSVAFRSNEYGLPQMSAVSSLAGTAQRATMSPMMVVIAGLVLFALVRR